MLKLPACRLMLLLLLLTCLSHSLELRPKRSYTLLMHAHLLGVARGVGGGGERLGARVLELLAHPLHPCVAVLMSFVHGLCKSYLSRSFRRL